MENGEAFSTRFFQATRYPYVVLAPEGGVDLAPYSHVARWMERVEQLPGWIAVDEAAAVRL